MSGCITGKKVAIKKYWNLVQAQSTMMWISSKGKQISEHSGTQDLLCRQGDVEGGGIRSGFFLPISKAVPESRGETASGSATVRMNGQQLIIVHRREGHFLCLTRKF